MIKLRFLPKLLLMLCFVAAAVAGNSAYASEAGGAASHKGASVASNILHLDQIHKGMKGYGLTIFSGSKIEPFRVEVVSVVSESSPHHSVIWITCPGKRLQISGPVEGMSGSPIYLWTKKGKHTPGKGGKLIGAFAYGFSLSKGCLAGVQPIQYMLKIPNSIKKDSKENLASSKTSPSSTYQALATLNRLKKILKDENIEHYNAPLINFSSMLLSGNKPNSNIKNIYGENHSQSNLLPGPSGKSSSAVHPLLLPLNVGSAKLAQTISPLLKPLGLNPVAAGNGLIAGKPPKDVDPAKVKLEPGSALMIPLAFGDLDLYGGGTVTTVLKNGTVLGFGHPMFGQGHETLPMATGYVHFIVPLLTASFKMMGSLNIVGSLLEDQSTGIAGVIGTKKYKTAPATVTVEYPHRKAHTYHYQIVNRLGLTPTIAAVLAIQSVGAVHQLPPLHTLKVNGSLTFSGNRKISFSSTYPSASAMAVIGDVLPIVSTMTQNQYKRLKLTGMNLTAKVIPGVDLATITNASINRTSIAPGETVTVNVQVRPFGKSFQYHQLKIKIPEDIAPGDYSLSISGKRSFASQFAASHPYLFDVKSVDDIWHTMQRVANISSKKIYATIRLKSSGLAIGRMGMDDLPSSVEAMIAAPTNTYTNKFNQIMYQAISVPRVIQGNITLRLHVRKPKDINKPQS